MALAREGPEGGADEALGRDIGGRGRGGRADQCRGRGQTSSGAAGTARWSVTIQRVEKRQSRHIGSAERIQPAVVPKNAMLNQDAGVIEPGYPQASNPHAANDDAPMLHRGSLHRNHRNQQPSNVCFRPIADVRLSRLSGCRNAVLSRCRHHGPIFTVAPPRPPSCRRAAQTPSSFPRVPAQADGRSLHIGLPIRLPPGGCCGAKRGVFRANSEWS